MKRQYRKVVIAGNWKMNMTASETKAYAQEIKPLVTGKKACEMLLCVPAINISTALTAFKGTKIAIGCENLHFNDSGAYTGEISAPMLTDLGVKYVILGHSERRQYFNEQDFTVNKKVHKCLETGITPIVCVGETLQQRELDATIEFLEYQVCFALAGLTPDQAKKVIIAYEPLWAIGTGKTATPEEAEEACAAIRAFIRRKFDARTARSVSILYGGSMNAKNARSLLEMEDIDGGLIGGASLKTADFTSIINTACEVLSEEKTK